MDNNTGKTENLDGTTAGSANPLFLPNVKAQRWTWLARDVLLGAQNVTDMAIRCSAWFGCIKFLALGAQNSSGEWVAESKLIGNLTHRPEMIQMAMNKTLEELKIKGIPLSSVTLWAWPE